jgi:hypothetical protein
MLVAPWTRRRARHASCSWTRSTCTSRPRSAPTCARRGRWGATVGVPATGARWLKPLAYAPAPARQYVAREWASRHAPALGPCPLRLSEVRPGAVGRPTPAASTHARGARGQERRDGHGAAQGAHAGQQLRLRRVPARVRGAGGRCRVICDFRCLRLRCARLTQCPTVVFVAPATPPRYTTGFSAAFLGYLELARPARGLCFERCADLLCSKVT